MSTAEPKNDYVSNSFWLLLEKSSRIISGILVGILVVRYLGDEQFGTIRYGLGVIGILTIFSTMGLDTLLVRELLTRKEKTDTLLGTAFGMRFLGSLVVVAGACFYSFLRDPAEVTFVVFLLSLSIVFQSIAVIDFYFQSQVKGKLTAINQVITLFVSALVKLVLIWADAPLVWFASMAAFEAGLTALNQLYFFHREGQQIRNWRFNMVEAKHLFWLAMPIIFSSFVQLLNQNVDSILIARFLRNMGPVGQYGAGVGISQASYFIPVALCTAVFPGIVNNRNNPELQQKRLTQLYSLLAWSSLIIIGGAWLLGDLVIGWMYGVRYPMAPVAFKIHILNSFPVYWGTAWGMWMVAQHRQKYILWMQLLSASVIISLELFLIPRMGIYGAAWALVTGSWVAMVFMLVSYRPAENLKVFVQALNPVNLLEVLRYWRK